MYVALGDKGTANEENKGAAKREEEELQRIKEVRRKEEDELLRMKGMRNREEEMQRKNREKLEMEINSLKLVLERDKKRSYSEQQVTEYKREIEKLREQLKKEMREKDKAIEELAGHRNGEKLRNLKVESDLKRQTDPFQIGTGLFLFILKIEYIARQQRVQLNMHLTRCSEHSMLPANTFRFYRFFV